MCELCDPELPALSRRHLMLGAGATLAASTLPWSPGWTAEPASDAAPNAIGPDAALERLKQGNERYVANAPNEKDYSAGRAARVSAQYPIAAILSCADSRVSPELVFDQGPGDLFVVRLAGNFVDDDGLASLEYAVKFLRVPLLMVLGHSNCGAVDAAIKVFKDNATLPGHLPGLVEAIRPAVLAAIAQNSPDLLSTAITENVRFNAKRLEVDTPIVAEAFASKQIGIAGGVYDLATGKVNLL
jgi:carbonic anhydrase